MVSGMLEMCSLQINSSFDCSGKMVDRVCDVTSAERLSMVAVSLWFKQMDVCDGQVDFIGGIFNAKRYCDDPEVHCCAIHPRPSTHVAVC